MASNSEYEQRQFFEPILIPYLMKMKVVWDNIRDSRDNNSDMVLDHIDESGNKWYSFEIIRGLTGEDVHIFKDNELKTII